MNSTSLPWGRFFSTSPALPQEDEPAPRGPSLEPSAPKPPQRPNTRLAWGLTLVLAAGVGIGVWAGRDQIFSPGTQGGMTSVPTAKVEFEQFRRSLRVSGTIAAKRFAAIRAPRMRGGSEGRRSLTLIELADAGSVIEANSVVGTFENRWLEDHIDDKRSELTQSKSAVEKRGAEIMIEEETQRQLLRVAKAEWEKAELDLGTAEVRSEIEAEKLKLAVEETKANFLHLEQELKLQQTADAAEIRSLELVSDKDALHVRRHMNDLERLNARTPVGGLVVMESLYRGGGQFEQVETGDQVSPGTFFMRVVDLSKMVVNGVVNQVDSQKVRLGQKAEIRLDAYPDLLLPGRVTAISAMASSTGGGSRWSRSNRDAYVKLVGIEVSIDGADKRVIPDLSASADVVLEQKADALLVPDAAVEHRDGKAFVYVRAGEDFTEREIEIGERNEVQAVVLSGLSAGEEIALTKPMPQA